MRLARFSDGAYYVPGAELLWLELDGETIGVRSREAYRHADGTLEPGVLESPVRTELRCLTYGADGQPDVNATPRFVPLVCKVCGDTGNSQRHTWGQCEACDGYGDQKNLHLCTECREFSDEVLPIHPRATVDHELLLPRAHVSCSVESLLAEMPFRFPASNDALAAAGLCSHCLTAEARA
jgi:hypothetical protein